MNFNNFRKVLLISIFLCLTTSCATVNSNIDNLQTIGVDINKATRFVNAIEYMNVIEMKDSTAAHLPGDLSKVIVSGDSIFILDIFKDQGLYVYDKVGHMLSSYNKMGSGPDEFISLSDFNITPNEIILLDPTSDGQLIILDRKCNFLRRENSETNANHFYIDSKNNGLWFDRGNVAYSKNKDKLVYYSGSKRDVMLKIPDKLENITFASSHSFARLTSDSILYLPPADKTIYLCGREEVVPIYDLDFKGKWPQLSNKGKNEHPLKIMRRIAKNKKVNALDILSDGKNIILTFNCADKYYILELDSYSSQTRLFYLSEKEHEEMGNVIEFTNGEIYFGIPGKIVKVMIK